MATPSEPQASAISSARAINTVSFKLDEDNFIPWRRQALAFIKSNRLKEHLNPMKIPKRFRTDGDRQAEIETQEFLDWEQDDQFLVSWLFASIDPSFTSQVANCEFACEIWYKLEEYFAKRLKSKVKQLKTQIKGIKLQGSVTEYMSKLKKVRNALSALGAPLSSEEFVEAVTQGLNEDYSAFITMINARADEITESEVESLLVGQEELVKRFKRTVLGTMQVNLAQNVDLRSQSQQPSYQMYQPNFQQQQQQFQGRGQNFKGRFRGRGGFRGGRSGFYGNSKPQCQLCNRFGHTVWECFHRFNHNFQNPHQTTGNPPTPPPSSFHQPQQDQLSLLTQLLFIPNNN